LLSQENFGIINSNYAPTNSLFINPSSLIDSRVYLDINILGASAYLMNDYFYSPKGSYNFKGLVKGDYDFSNYELNRNSKTNNVYSRAFVHGPSFTLSSGDYAIGLYTGARTILSINNLSTDVANYIADGYGNIPEHNIGNYKLKNIRGGGLALGEIGLTLAKTIQKRNDVLISAGANIKYLYGLGGAGFNIHNASFLVKDVDEVNTYKFSSEYMYVNSMGINAGRGWGVDLGITYKKMKGNTVGYFPNSPKSFCETKDYKYELGFSILDLGGVNFENNMAYKYVDESIFNNRTSEDLEEMNDLEDFERLVGVNTDDKTKYLSNSGRINLPTAISIQGDVHLKKNLYVSGVMVQRIPMPNKFGPERSNSLAITPRWESKHVEVAMPFSLYEYKKPQLGLMLRLNNLIIGSDKIGAFFNKSDVYGADIYFNLKWMVFKHPKCRVKKKKTSCEAYN